MCAYTSAHTSVHRHTQTEIRTQKHASSLPDYLTRSSSSGIELQNVLKPVSKRTKNSLSVMGKLVADELQSKKGMKEEETNEEMKEEEKQETTVGIEQETEQETEAETKEETKEEKKQETTVGIEQETDQETLGSSKSNLLLRNLSRLQKSVSSKDRRRAEVKKFFSRKNESTRIIQKVLSQVAMVVCTHSMGPLRCESSFCYPVSISVKEPE